MEKHSIIKDQFDGKDTIAHIMFANGLSTLDIIRKFQSLPASAQFDLIVKYQDMFFRVPFNADITGVELIGICPFKDSDEYLELKEIYARPDQCNVADFPSVDFLERISKIRDDVNNAMNMLVERGFEAQIVNGIYHAKSQDGLLAKPVVVEMTDRAAYEVRSVAVGTPARARYVGRIKTE